MGVPSRGSAVSHCAISKPVVLQIHLEDLETCDTADPRFGTPIGLAGRWVERAVGFVKIIERFRSLAPSVPYLPLVSNQIRGHREVLL